jgi:type IV pilus assembly protein PilQ
LILKMTLRFIKCASLLVAVVSAAMLTSCKTSALIEPGGSDSGVAPEVKATEEIAPGRSGTPGDSKRSIAGSGDSRIAYSQHYDQQMTDIFALASKREWEKAELAASALFQSDPNDPAVERIYNWVQKQRDLLRGQAVEDQIRRIDAKSSVFNPTVPRILGESKDRGLPPRKDLRDAVGTLEAVPYVPDSFGRTIPGVPKNFDPEENKSRMREILTREISSIHLDDVSLDTIIFKIGEAEGINFIADRSIAAFQKKLSVNMESVHLSELLTYISRNLGVHFQIGDDLIWIVDGADASKLFEETRFYRLRRGFVIPAQFGASAVKKTTTTNKGTTTVMEQSTIEQFVQDGASESPAIEQAIKKFFKGSEYLIDYERNIIAAAGTPEQLEVIERIIKEFDQPIQQVLIEARFVTVTEAAFMELGALWETGRAKLASREAVDFTGLGTNVGLGLQETVGGVLGRDDLSVTIKALEQSGESQTLSSPRITLINNLPAKISDGKVQYYYEEYTVSQEITELATSSSLVPKGVPSKITSGVSLDVVASIGGDGQNIMLALHPEVNQDVRLVTFATISDVDAGGNIRSFDIRLPESRTQSLSTRVIVKSGETVVMGGVLEREQTTFVESVPVLGNIPLLGSLFRKRIEVDKPRYLLIFVTATILSESGEFIRYQPEGE